MPLACSGVFDAGEDGVMEQVEGTLFTLMTSCCDACRLLPCHFILARIISCSGVGPIGLSTDVSTRRGQCDTLASSIKLTSLPEPPIDYQKQGGSSFE